MTLYDVNEYNIISFVDHWEPTSNGEAFDVSKKDLSVALDVVRLAEQNGWFAGFAESVWTDHLQDFLDFVESTDVLTEEQHQFYKKLRRGVPGFSELKSFIRHLPESWSEDFVTGCHAWLGLSPCRESAEDWAFSSSPVQVALDFFQFESRALRDEAGIVIIEGEHPGSSYYAAELHAQIDEANAVLQRHGRDYRFQRVEG